jgi:hypothetical protein
MRPDFSSCTRSIAAIATTAVVLYAPTAGAEEHGRLKLFGHRYSVIGGASTFVPQLAATRTAFGDRTFSPVLTLWSFDTPRGVGLSWDLGGARLKEGSRVADIAHGGVGPRLLFADTASDFAPYLTVRADAYAMRLDRGDWRLKPGANVELGASVLRHVVISARYDRLPRIGGMDLSGFSGRLAIKLF